MHVSRIFVAAIASVAMAGCGHSLPGKPNVPGSDKIPGGAGGLAGQSGEVDPNTCGNYASSDAGAKLKVFLQATKDLQTATTDMAKTVKDSCVLMGQELGMAEGDLGGDDTGALCTKVFAAYQNNLKVAFKAGAKLKIAYTPGQCKLDAAASASAGGGCSGSASADNSGGSGQGECKAAAQVHASIHAECTPPKLTIEADAKIIVDKSKAEATLKAARDALPKLLEIKAKVQPIQEAAGVWVKAAGDLKDMGAKFAQSFKDQALCISGQVAATANAATNIQANVSVSVSVSASASGSVGG